MSFNNNNTHTNITISSTLKRYFSFFKFIEFLAMPFHTLLIVIWCVCFTFFRCWEFCCGCYTHMHNMRVLSFNEIIIAWENPFLSQSQQYIIIIFIYIKYVAIYWNPWDKMWMQGNNWWTREISVICIKKEFYLGMIQHRRIFI